jgi:ATP-dependent exoDNAse (exonuclease V) beta subunit
VETATARSRTAPAAGAIAVETVELRDFTRPRGRRFGTLVHAVLAEVDLSAASPEVAKVARAQGRILGASGEEVTAAARAASAALAHPLLRRAASAEECRREEPLIHRLEDGTLLEGIVDLAYRDAAGWTVVDFKTDAEPDSHPRYAAQLRLYCAAITAVTGLPARPALLAV